MIFVISAFALTLLGVITDVQCHNCTTRPNEYTIHLKTYNDFMDEKLTGIDNCTTDTCCQRYCNRNEVVRQFQSVDDKQCMLHKADEYHPERTWEALADASTESCPKGHVLTIDDGSYNLLITGGKDGPLRNLMKCNDNACCKRYCHKEPGGTKQAFKLWNTDKKRCN